MSDCKVERVGRQVIENKLLTGLEDGSHAALLVSEEDLSLIIKGLRELDSRKADEMAKDFQKLKDSAFP